MGSGSAAWKFKKCIMRYSQKRLRTFTCRGRRNGCMYAGDFSSSSEMSTEFQPSKRSLTSELLINKQFPDSLKNNSSSTSPAAAPCKDESPRGCVKTAVIAQQDESQREASKPLASEPMQQPVAQDPPKVQESPRPMCAQHPRKRIVNVTMTPANFTVHGSEISSERKFQTEPCASESESRTANYEDPMLERIHKPIFIAPDPKKGILKPGISMVHESEVPSNYKIQTGFQPYSEAQTLQASAEPPCNHPPQTHADGNCRSSAASQQNASSCNQTALIVSAAPTGRSASDLGRSFGLIKVPPSRGSSPWSLTSSTAQSPRTATLQAQTCSHCQLTHNLGRPPRVLKAEQIKLATNNFCKKNFLDNGEWEFVYKGCLEGQPVAVKTIRHENSIEKFSAEIAVLTFLQHPSVVSLVGYCLEDNDRALVYNFACNRSLYWHLCCMANGTKLMAWPIRKSLAVNLGRGLNYLHSECRGGGVIHGDFRSRNIFLNHDMVPVIGGFGQSRWQESGLNPLNSRPQKGYPGYVAPEYLEGGPISEKVDVYGFGILLLELITGRKAVDLSRPEEEQHLVDWARPWLESPTDYETVKKELLDTQLMASGQECIEGDVMSTIHAARLCLRTDPLMRPRISQVLDILHHGEFQDNCSPSSLRSSTISTGKEIVVATTNRTAQSAALATLRAATDPAETTSSSLALRHLNSSEDMEYHSAPSTPNLNEIVRRDTDCPGILVCGRRRSSSAGRKGSGKVTQLLYQPLHYFTNSSYNKPRHRVSFKKGTSLTRIDDYRRAYSLLNSLFHVLNFSSRKVFIIFKRDLLKEVKARRSPATDLIGLGWTGKTD